MSRPGRGQTRKGWSRKAPRFIMLEHHLVDHPAFRALDAFSVQAPLILARQYRGSEGYRIEASHRFIAKAAHCSPGRALKSLGRLKAAGFIIELSKGCMGVEGHGRGTVWRLTWRDAAGLGTTRDYERIHSAAIAENPEPRVSP